MDRNDVIKTLKRIGSRFAKELGFVEVMSREDREKGIWGEATTRQLEREYGPCTEEIRWYGDSEEEYVEFRFRFATPVLGIHLMNGVFASIEIGQRWNSEKECREGEFDFREAQVLQSEGVDLLHKLLDAWNDEKEALKSAEAC